MIQDSGFEIAQYHSLSRHGNETDFQSSLINFNKSSESIKNDSTNGFKDKTNQDFQLSDWNLNNNQTELDPKSVKVERSPKSHLVKSSMPIMKDVVVKIDDSVSELFQTLG